jgi:protein O-GlcNAc transferase
MTSTHDAFMLSAIQQFQAGEREAAVARLLEYLKQHPDSADGHNNVGAMLGDLGRHVEAVEHLSRAVELDPASGPAHSNLARSLRSCNVAVTGDLPAHLDALLVGRRATELDPNNPDAWINLGGACVDRELLEEARAAYQRALELVPGNLEVHSNLLLTMQYVSDISAQEIHEETLRWGEKAKTRMPQDSILQSIDTPRRALRIGYISGDFRLHPSMRWFETVLASHDKQAVETHLFYTHHLEDEVTQRVKTKAHAWHPLEGLSAEQCLTNLREAELDVLVDLSGHTAHNKLGVLAQRAAPVQATWMGYLGSSGCPNMDFVIADENLIPEEHERFFTEKIARMPDIAYCYSPPEDEAPEVSPPPCLTNGFITFGCFNAAVKVNPGVLEVWSEILRRIPNSRLLLKAGAFSDPSTVKRFQTHFGDLADRVEFVGRTPRAQYYADFSKVDIALDPWPYNGGTTTADGLWMGVPALTLPGERMVQRAGLTMLRSVGLHDWIATSVEDYVEKAVALASDHAHLAELRSELRDQTFFSPMCDRVRFTRNLEALLVELAT